MHKFSRLVNHLTASRRKVWRHFPLNSLNAIEAAISSSEKSHMGELRFVVEAGLKFADLFSDINARDRAIQVFSDLRIWDTEHNSGVLIYMLLADHKIEIVADRGINARVEQAEWDSICRDMEKKFRIGEFENGVLLGITSITRLLQKCFPARDDNPDDLPNRPAIL